MSKKKLDIWLLCLVPLLSNANGTKHKCLALMAAKLLVYKEKVYQVIFWKTILRKTALKLHEVF